MTEEAWLRGDDLLTMLRLVLGSSPRKDRLFTAACCWRWCHTYEKVLGVLYRSEDDNTHSESVAKSIQWISRLIEMTEGPEVLHNPRNAFHGSLDEVLPGNREAGNVLRLVRAALEPGMRVVPALMRALDDHGREGHERLMVSALVREVYENPFNPVSVDPSWLTSTVLDLARTIYQKGAYDILPILADALQDAGCDNDDVLNHLRGPGPHVRGCWAIDLLLGKS